MGKKKRKKQSNNKISANDFKFDNGFVFYQRLVDSANSPQGAIWNTIYQTALNDFEGGIQFFNLIDSNTIGNSLISQGYAEQTKELNFLNKAFGIQINGDIPLSEYNSYINQINDILDDINEYKRISNLLKQNSTQKKMTKEDYDEIISIIDTHFYNYFYDDVYNFLYKNTDQLYLNNANAFIQKITDIAQLSLDKAISKLNLNKNKVKNDNARVWLEALKLLQKSEKQFQRLNSVLFQRYNLDNVLDSLYKWDKDRRKSNTKSLKGLSDQIKRNLKFNVKEFNSIDKVVSQITSSLSGNYTLTSSGTKKIGNQSLNLNTVTLISVAGRIGLEGITDFFTSQITNENSLEEIAEIIDNFNNYISTFRDIFTIYQAVDLEIDEGMSGSYPLSMLPAFLDRIGTSIDGDKLINVLYNTIPGAIGANRADEIKDNISLAMSEAMAGYLFNDWNSIGNSTGTGIHLFNLDGVKIPLSYLLIAAGETVLEVQNNPSSYFDINFNLPGNILYPEPINPFDKSIGMKGYWEEQRNAALNNSAFSLRFMQDFKGKIKSLLNRI